MYVYVVIINRNMIITAETDVLEWFMPRGDA